MVFLFIAVFLRFESSYIINEEGRIQPKRNYFFLLIFFL